MVRCRKLAERSVDGADWWPGLGGDTAESSGAWSAQRLICLQRWRIFLCRGNLDALWEKQVLVKPQITWLLITRLYFSQVPGCHCGLLPVLNLQLGTVLPFEKRGVVHCWNEGRWLPTCWTLDRVHESETAEICTNKVINFLGIQT